MGPTRTPTPTRTSSPTSAPTSAQHAQQSAPRQADCRGGLLSDARSFPREDVRWRCARVHVYVYCRCTVHDKLSCTRLQNYTIGASQKSVSVSVYVSVPWGFSFRVDAGSLRYELNHDKFLVVTCRPGIRILVLSLWLISRNSWLFCNSLKKVLHSLYCTFCENLIFGLLLWNRLALLEEIFIMLYFAAFTYICIFNISILCIWLNPCTETGECSGGFGWSPGKNVYNLSSIFNWLQNWNLGLHCLFTASAFGGRAARPTARQPLDRRDADLSSDMLSMFSFYRATHC